MTMTQKVLFVLFLMAAVVLLPLTGLWALFAGLAGHMQPLTVLRGKQPHPELDPTEEV